MPAMSHKVKKKRVKTEKISQQDALDFAQLILHIFKDKKRAQD
jgi:hypothetical protein